MSVNVTFTFVVTQNGEMELNNTALSFDTNSDSKQKQKNKI